MIGPKTPPPTPREEKEAYELVMVRDEGVCQKCRRHGQTINRDHRKDRSTGGLTVVENLQLLCGSGTTGCHGWKSSHPDDANREGWGVPGWADPLTYPARRWIRNVIGVVRLRWVLYRADGRYVVIPDEDALRRIEQGHMYEEDESA